ncbi:MAG: BLUF domain-containing protein [Chitinivorax sp.]
MNQVTRETILIVDDMPENISILAEILRQDYRVTFATNGPDALLAAREKPKPGLILLDVMMPGMSGYEVCQALKGAAETANIPVIFLTSKADVSDEEIGLRLGAVDYLHKPCHPAIVKQRVRNHLTLHNYTQSLEQKVRERTRELEQTRIEIIRRLGRAAEYRDNETGMHVMRMSSCCHKLAIAAGLSPQRAELLQLAAPMHDIGKIGIPDHILLKPGKLDSDEWATMQRHVEIGAAIIGEHKSDLLAMARLVALAHHERWDGHGYPYGLAGEAIPIEGRIAAICDVFDALLSKRPYKEPWPEEKAIAFIAEQSGKAFDPALVKLFIELTPELQRIRGLYLDDPEEQAPQRQLVQLIYVSSAHQELEQSELLKVLDASIRHNNQNKLSGMLLYAKGSFIQVLEGSEAAVTETMRRIAADPRHHSIYTLQQEPINEREFAQWAMGFHQLNQDDVAKHPHFTPFLERGFNLGELNATPGLAMELLKQFANQA